MSPCPDFLPIDGGAMGLGAIFQYEQAMLFGNGHDAGHVGRAAIEMDGDDALGALGDAALR